MKNKTKGFTFVELLCALLIIGILALIATIAVSSAIASANYTRIQSDFQEMESDCTLVMLENPGISKINGYQPKSILSYFVNTESTMAIDFTHCGDNKILRNGGSKIESLQDTTSKMLIGLKSIDPWGTPYRIYVQANDLKATGTGAGDAELRIFVISSGENRKSNDLPNMLDSDDICMLVENVNGKVRVGYHNLVGAPQEEICWMSDDSEDISACRVDPKNSNAVLNMNYATLEPVKSYE